MRDTDGQLLESFARDRDEVAFRLLAKRHLGLVFHAALRRTGNRPLAEEISQNVLLALARKSAALAKEPERLPAWLHRATLFESSKAMRAESSYQRRKDQGQDGPQGSCEGSEAAWLDALPYLDLALDKLPEADRRVLLLHYFEEHPFPQIAAHLGKNVAAVQKQAQRALGKLSRILRTKGIALSVTTLGAGLSHHTAKAAPEALIHSASSFAVAGSGAPVVFSLTAMIASKPKVAVPLFLLLLGSPLAFQRLAIARQQDRIEALRGATATPAKVDRTTARRTSADATSSGSLDLLVLAKEQADATRIGGETQRRFEAKLAGLDPDTLAGLIRRTGSAELGKEKKTALLGSLLAAISETDPGRGISAAIQGMPEGPSLRNLIFEAGIDTILSDWAAKDAAAAIAWFRENRNLPKLNAGPRSALDKESRPTVREDLESQLLHRLIRTSSPEAAAYLSSLPDPERLESLTNSLRALKLIDMSESLPNDWLPPFLQVIRENVPRSQQEPMVGMLAAGTDWKRLRQVLAGAGATSEETEILARVVAQDQFHWQHIDRWQYHKHDPLDPGVLECVEELVPGRGQEILDEARAAAHQAACQRAADTLAQVRAGSALPDDVIFWKLTRETDLTSHLPEALELTSRIKDPGLRQKAIDHLNAKTQTHSNP
jgi:RNA polymerase sigma factor (sigma-70 family)